MSKEDLLKIEFIEKARKIHGDKYNYDKVVYINAFTKVIITCPIHGDFLQTPNNHLGGHGCPYCAARKRVDKRTSTKEEFIEKAKKIHGDKYNYDKVVYVNSKTPVIITCPIHGDFLQTPNRHLSGNGCPKCANDKKHDIRRSNTEEFIEKARKIHGDKYNYDKVVYVNNWTPVIITCPIHGDFLQMPREHLSGKGCPKCSFSKLERTVSKLLEENGIKFESQKIFDWLINDSCNHLKLDFYLPDYNIVIECQGLQHFQPIDYFGGEKHFKSAIENDKLKLDLCEKHGIKVIYYSDLGIEYPYEVFEDLDEILKIIKDV